MARCTVSVVVERPKDEIFAFVADRGNDPKWHPASVEVERLTGGPIGVGTRYRNRIHAMGRDSEVTLEYTEFEPNRKVAWKGTPFGPAEPRSTVTFEEVAQGTRVTWTNMPRVRGVFKLLDPLLSRAIRKETEWFMANLKPILETENSSS